MFEGRLDRLSPGDTLAAVEACTRQLVQAENSVLELAAHFADQHPAETVADEPLLSDRIGRRRPRKGRESAVLLGGEGTARVAEFCVADFAVAIHDSHYRARGLIAAALDLRHRLPNLWARVRNGTARGWKAQKVAELTRPLSLEAARKVDRKVAASVETLPWTRLKERVNAEMLKADPKRADREWKRAANERFVSISDKPRFGTRTIRARIGADAALQLGATLDDLATASLQDKSAAECCDDPDLVQEVGLPVDLSPVSARQLARAEAFEKLGNPLLALRTLAETRQPALFEPLAEPSTDTPASDTPAPAARPAPTESPKSARPTPPTDTAGPSARGDAAERSATTDTTTEPSSSAATGDSPRRGHRGADAGDLDWLTKIDLRKLLPQAVLHVHISRESLKSAAADPDHAGPAITRIEQIGPELARHTRQWLGTRWKVRVQPVVDLADVRPVDGYEVPDAMRNALLLRTPVSCFPWSSNDRRSMDADHTPAYRFPTDGDPPEPGQTGLHSLGPLGRWEHRVSTHGRWSVRQPVPGTHVWRTSFGQVLITNDSGTHHIGDHSFADAIWAAAGRQDRIGRDAAS